VVSPRESDQGLARRRRIVHALLGLGLAAAAAGWWFEDALPGPETIHPRLLAEPLQSAVEAPMFKATVHGIEYIVRPRYSYDISGLVVSRHDTDAWWDTAHRDDLFNPVDLCVVWGRNASTGLYRDMRFQNGQWTCYAQQRGGMVDFDLTQFSNNHLVTDRGDVRRAVRRIRIGDQVRLRGYLVDYGVLRDGGPAQMRVSSNTRLDTGPGACEIVLVTSVESLGSAPAVWRMLWYGGLTLLAVGGVAWLRLPLPRVDESDLP